MKRTLSLILALTLALSCLFTLIACSGCKEHVDADYDEICDVCEEAVPHTPEYLGFEGLYNTDYEEDEKTVYGTASLVEALNNMSVYSTNGNLITFKNNNAKSGEKKLAVLNTETGAVVYTLTKEDDGAKVTTDATVYSSGNESFIRVTTTNRTDKNSYSYTYKLLTSLGKEITSKTNKSASAISVTPIVNDLYEIDGKLYEIEDGVATLKQELGLAGYTVYDAETEKYNYAFSKYEALVYDKDGKLVASYTVPTTADAEFYILSNGNIFIQYTKALPEDATEFDYYNVNNDLNNDLKDDTYTTFKYDLTSLIFDVETKTENVLELNYLVETLVNEVTAEKQWNKIFAKDKLHNLAIYYNIVDKMINNNEPVIADMSDTMLTIGYLAEEVAGQKNFAELIADNRFTVRDEVSGKKYLINEKGVVLGEVTGASYNSSLGLFVRNGKYYDLDLKEVFNIETIEYSKMYSSSYYTLYKDVNTDADDNDVTTYYIGNGASNPKQITVPKGAYNFIYFSNYFYYQYTETVSGTTKYYRDYCNANGELIKRVEINNGTSYEVVVYNSDAFVLMAETYENYTYTYRYYIAK